MLFFLLAFLLGCGGQEREASNMLLQATGMVQQGNWMELKSHLDKIISEYPETEAAPKAAEMRDEMVGRVNQIAKTALQSALSASIGYAVSYPDETLDLVKLREFGFEGVEGVRSE
jgi:hypothetical protein